MAYYGRKTKVKVFVSFDYDHDQDLKMLFCGQAAYDGTPFEITDVSVKEHLAGDWREIARQKILRSDQVVVICGEYTHTATGVSDEIRIAQNEGKPYFLLKGRRDKYCTKPVGAKATDSIYTWTWDNVGKLLNGAR